jgi:Methylamine utilisation protein MauE
MSKLAAVNAVPAIGLALMWTVAAVLKLADVSGIRDTAEATRLPSILVHAAPVGLPLVELMLAAALAVPTWRIYGAGGSALLLGVFVVFLTRAILRGDTDTGCRCFGPLSGTSLTWRHVVIDVGLLAISLGVFSGVTNIEFGASSLVAFGALGVLALWNLARPRSRNRLADNSAQVRSGETLRMLGDQHLIANALRAVILLTPSCEQCRTVLRHRLDEWIRSFSEGIQFFAMVEHEDDSPAVRPAALPRPATAEARRAVIAVPAGTAQRLGFSSTPGAVILDGRGQLQAGPAFGVAAISVMLRDARAALSAGHHARRVVRTLFAEN